ncbi:MAG: MMPL family protein [Candidatus Argoarchaeum ethanivorans]|uniref:MMPL family protein n=1 Tax=Candidatus Argoarchaeum ethanivorans TaxID=2608793 RepID=A0A811T6P0_9EURY|nr:MAG: MMPL family protein [Candidatus Argoarchaeum ethanivorans]CAD6494368.1 MAG: MMPL family protein [Candidatus Argoarchaeum ethanivorans]
MPTLFDKVLIAIARCQKKYTRELMVIIILITILLGSGLKDMTINSDVRSEMPGDLPIFKLNDRINDKFGGQDTVVIAVKIDESVNSKKAVRDIRDSQVIESLLFLDESLRDESMVQSVTSPASFFRSMDEISDDNVSLVIEKNPAIEKFFSRDYRMTLMYVSADIGSDDVKIQSFIDIVHEKIDYTPKPPGVKFGTTGSPVLRVSIFDLLKSDALTTLLIAACIILLLLFVMEQSFTRGLLIFIPLSLGLIWTMGTLGWLGIPLSIATVCLSSMILGLGVEYGVFMVTRYKEERDKGRNQSDSVETAVHGIGTAIIGSGLTTIVGFGVLSFSSVPMMQHLGQTLALGIFYSLMAALFANPVLMILEEDFEHHRTEKLLKRFAAKREIHVRRPR